MLGAGGGGSVKHVARDLNQLNQMVTANSVRKTKPEGWELLKTTSFASNLWKRWVKLLLLVFGSMLGCV